jgi:hypothetical protein
MSTAANVNGLRLETAPVWMHRRSRTGAAVHLGDVLS